MSRNMAAVEKEILIKNAMLATRASYQSPPLPEGETTISARLLVDSIDINEVYPNVFISDEGTARRKSYLVSVGITHVLNTAEGVLMGYVNTSTQFYQGTGIVYKGYNLADLAQADASRYFKDAAGFIDSALRAGGRVLVHCKMGMSRSGIMVLAFLVLKRDLTAIDAMKTVRQKRNIHPNDGFIHQLAKLDNKLFRQRKRSVSPERSAMKTLLF